MNDLPAPPVPELSRDTLIARRNRLVAELDARPRWQPSKRLAAAGIGTLGAIGAVTAILAVLLVGGETSSAFAGWTADPTAPLTGQIQAAESSCEHAPSLPSDLTTVSPSLVDTRGPYTLLVYSDDVTSGLCITGVRGSDEPPGVGGLSVTDATPVAPDSIRPGEQGQQIAISRTSSPTTALSWSVGRVGTNVTAVTLVLDDGSSIEATTANGWYAAWWPGGRAAQTADLTTTSGAATQQLAPTTSTPVPANSGNPPSSVGSTGATGASGTT
jgi:hypothetical protein